MAPPNGDYNLLFGVLAWQLDFVSREALLAAMHAWVLDKKTPLGQILFRQGAFDSSTHALIEALVEKHLRAHRGDPRKSLAALGPVGAIRDDLAAVPDADVRAGLTCLSTVRPASEAAPDSRPPSSELPTSPGMRFRVLRPHAKGGLGMISVAFDEELRREVALKEIQERHADDPGARARFLLEAEVTGRLEHPGIVPVYGLGHSLDGRPFYAMRLVKGNSLHEAAKRFHAADTAVRNAGQRTLALRQLLGRFVDVCNAVAYAHSKGVLHRDLKPDNILLGPYGETLVVDWGLAKLMGQPDGGEADSLPSCLTVPGPTAPTQAGQAVGTPAYMSPEQAAGRLDRLGVASDVYSLGATLYHLLTGQPPVSGSDTGEILRRVERGEVTPARAVNAAVPASLEAVCLKALALRPEDRYASARALADDVEHWLADEPVAALRESSGQRLARWGRRHRAWVRAGAVALVLVSVVAVTAAVLVNGSRQTAERALHSEQDQHRKVEQTLADSRRLAAHLALDRGLALHHQGDRGRALLWLARALELSSGTLPDVEQAARLALDWASRGERLGRPFYSEGSYVSTTALHPDGKTLLAVGGTVAESKLHFWNVTTGKSIDPPLPTGGIVSHAAFSPDGHSLLLAYYPSENGQSAHVEMWDAHTRQRLTKFPPVPGKIDSVSFSPDSQRVLLALHDPVGGTGIVHLWEARSGRPAGEPLRFKGPVTVAAFHPDGRTFLTGSDPEGICIWQTATGKPAGRARRMPGRILAATFNRDGQTVHTAHLAVPRGTQSFRAWDVARGQPLGDPVDLPGGLTVLRVAPDGRTVFTWGPGQPGALRDMTTGKELRRLLPALPETIAVHPTEDGRTILLNTLWGNRLWDTEAQKARDFPQSVRRLSLSASLSPDGRTLAALTDEGSLLSKQRVEFLDTATGQKQGSVSDGVGSRVFFSSDSSRALVASLYGEKKTTLRTLRFGAPMKATPAVRVQGLIADGAFSGDGCLALTVVPSPRGNEVFLWNADTGQQLGTPISLAGEVHGGFGPGGRVLLLIGDSGQGESVLQLWETSAGRSLARVSVPPRSNYFFSPDCQKLLVVSGGQQPGGVARLLEVASGNWLTKPLRVRGTIQNVRFRGSTPVLLEVMGAPATPVCEINHWDPRSGVDVGPAVVLSGSFADIGSALSLTGSVEAVRFCPGGRLVMAMGSGLRFWETSAGHLLADTRRGELRVMGRIGDFSPDGRSLPVASILSVYVLQLPQPLKGDARRILCWAELTAGQRLDEGTGQVLPLRAEERKQRRRLLEELGGPPLP